MAELVAEARRLIDAAAAAIAVSTREPLSPAMAMLARIIVSEAKKLRPNNLRLQSIDLDQDSLDWTDINAAMSVVMKTLSESARSPVHRFTI